MITTNNINRIIEEYTNKSEIEIITVTKSNGSDFQIWKRDVNGVAFDLIPNLHFDYNDFIVYTNSDLSFGDLYIKDLVIFLRNQKLNQLLNI